MVSAVTGIKASALGPAMYFVTFRLNDLALLIRYLTAVDYAHGHETYTQVVGISQVVYCTLGFP